MTAERQIAVRIVRKLRRAGHVAYFAGGCVRDQLLGLEPKDYDVATDATPERVREIFPRTQAVGEHFGVILVRLDGMQTEVATFRNDGNYKDGRRPESVEFTTAEQDAKRRDFTINGLFYDPIDDKIIDYVGGQADLQAKVLRAIGDPAERFTEDHLRLLRAVRFAARFGLEIEPCTWDAIVANADKLKLIAPERVGDEMRRILVHKSRGASGDILFHSGLLDVLFRYCPSGEMGSPVRGFFKPAGVLKALDENNFAAALTALALDVSDYAIPDWIGVAEERAEWRTGLRKSMALSNQELDAVDACMASSRLTESGTTAARRRALGSTHGNAVLIYLMAIESNWTDRDRVGSMARKVLAWADHDNAPPRLLTGGDLITAGWTPGPEFSRVLEAVYDAQLEDRVRSKEEALALACSLK